MDILKVIVILFVWVLLICKLGKKINLSYLILLQVGLFLMLFGAFLDFTDDISSLDNVIMLGDNYILHDFFEDQIGATLGLLLFSVTFLMWVVKKLNAKV